MDIIEYLLGKGGFALLGLVVIVVLLYNKIKARREFRVSPKKKNK
ncbi:hypothetical protein SAMN04487910_0212 [Aquimarina amphilecti]|uniref:Uncharacterized protein n=1 Tax=Aquimarina amphilecti TaxID=1038014 RepID=A0A1H7G4R8_AQUAM|nr:hypothetical protein [Aquimarina amphilecti]SEK30705.1 hypothetical protein SAMN04487910_0212 [Aquimarina amphilecti]